MRKGAFFLNFLLTALVGLACLAGLLMRTFAPSVRVPEMNLSTVLLLSLAALMLLLTLMGGCSSSGNQAGTGENISFLKQNNIFYIEKHSYFLAGLTNNNKYVVIYFFFL